MNAAAAPNDTGNWGPWAPAIDWAEKLARLRSLRTLVDAMYGTKHPLVRPLAIAESGEPEDLQLVAIELDRMPAKDRRKVLSIYARVIGYKPKPEPEDRS